MNYTCDYCFHAGSSAFSATGVAVISGTTDIRFPTVIINTGGDYNTGTGMFTCRVAGLYWFSATIGKNWSNAVDYVLCYIMLNGVSKIYLYTDPYSDNRDGYSSTGSVAFQLRPGDRVHVGDCRHAEDISNREMTHFSGMLVRPDVWTKLKHLAWCYRFLQPWFNMFYM